MKTVQGQLAQDELSLLCDEHFPKDHVCNYEIYIFMENIYIYLDRLLENMIQFGSISGRNIFGHSIGRAPRKRSRITSITVASADRVRCLTALDQQVQRLWSKSYSKHFFAETQEFHGITR
jgi:hypothetical protein